MTIKFASALALLLLASAARAADDRSTPKKGANPEQLFFDLSKVGLGSITRDEDKKKYLYTIELEKSRITRKTLQVVYENAHDLYRAGDFEGARELTGRILSIDPAYQDAAILQRATIDLQGSKSPRLSEQKLVDNKFEEGMVLYRQGRLVESEGKLDEALKLSPNNLKARYWLTKVREELAEEHFRRGQLAYRQHRLRETLDQWYAALVLNPRYPRLVSAISKVEAELRQSDANDKLQSALQLYSQGKSQESLQALEQVLQVEPGDPKAQRLMAEIRAEAANQHVAEGRRLYGMRQYTPAIAAWKKAVDNGYDPRSADLLIARAKEQMKRESEAKKRAEEDKKRRDDEEKARQEEEAKRKADEEEKAKKEAEAKLSAKPPVQPELPAVTSEENKRSAIQHWNAGLIYYQQGQYEKARDEWILCKQLDPGNSDCVSGLQRIDQQFGGP
ncbi:MAG: hypothetical protein HY059_09800 [Proteobacteria bacterium]|nr:hypothetical protein [Pseudomonadota bacterium]